MQVINRTKQSIALAVLVIAGNSLAVSPPAMTKTEFRDRMDKLWDDHVTWTRLYIVSAAPISRTRTPRLNVCFRIRPSLAMPSNLFMARLPGKS